MKLEKYTLFSVLKISEGKKHKCWQQLRLGCGRFMGVLFCVLDFSILPKASTKNTTCFHMNILNKSKGNLQVLERPHRCTCPFSHWSLWGLCQVEGWDLGVSRPLVALTYLCYPEGKAATHPPTLQLQWANSIWQSLGSSLPPPPGSPPWPTYLADPSKQIHAAKTCQVLVVSHFISHIAPPQSTSPVGPIPDTILDLASLASSYSSLFNIHAPPHLRAFPPAVTPLPEHSSSHLFGTWLLLSFHTLVQKAN